MRGIFWRVLALALASVIAWLLCHWPEAPQPFVLELEQPCNLNTPHDLQEIRPGVIECWDGDKRVEYRSQ